MNPLVIACSILKDEVSLVVEEHGLQDKLDFIWMPDSLHNSPEHLRESVQEKIDAADSARPVILLCYGQCGNAFLGLAAREAPVVIARAADCVGMLLAEDPEIDELRKHSIFQTRGTLDGEQSLEPAYEHLVQRKGEDYARRVTDAMYKNYDTLVMVDTGAYDLPAQAERVKRVCSLYHLSPTVRPGTLSLLERLLTRDTDDGDFITIPPHGTATLADFFPELVS